MLTSGHALVKNADTAQLAGMKSLKHTIKSNALTYSGWPLILIMLNNEDLRKG